MKLRNTAAGRLKVPSASNLNFEGSVMSVVSFGVVMVRIVISATETDCPYMLSGVAIDDKS
jgi:hypothetical protein